MYTLYVSKGSGSTAIAKHKEARLRQRRPACFALGEAVGRHRAFVPINVRHWPS